MFYSKYTGGFYSAKIHGSNIPSDAVEITIEQHFELLQGQSNGKVISADINGNPVLTDAPVPELVIPTIVTMVQARLALHQLNLLEPVEISISSLDRAAQIEWEFRATVQRDSALVQALASGLQLDKNKLDELFTLAASL